MSKVLVIGGGAAGMMAAITAARLGADVTIFDISEDFIKHQRDEKSSLQKPKYGREVENNIYYLLNEDLSAHVWLNTKCSFVDSLSVV